MDLRTVADWHLLFALFKGGHVWPCCGHKSIHAADCPYVAAVHREGGLIQTLPPEAQEDA